MQQNQINGQEAEAQDDSALSKVIERNIRTIIHLCTKAAHQRGVQDRIADAITSLQGKPYE